MANGMQQSASHWHLDSESMAIIRLACQKLKEVCDGARKEDGVGFNGADAEFGHKLAELPAAWWTPARYYAAWNMLRKYRVQLGKLGVDYGHIRDVPDPRVIPLAQYREMGLPENLPNGQPRRLGVDADAAHQQSQRQLNELIQNDPDPARAKRIVEGLIEEVRNLPPFTPDDARFAPLRRLIAEERRGEAPDHMALSLNLTARDILGPRGVIAGKLPGYESRGAQLDLAELIEMAMDEGFNAATEAGTGTGKSMAYLVPAILMACLERVAGDSKRLRTIVSTADKALQEQIWKKDIPFLLDVMPKPFTAALLKGRSNYLCLYQLEVTKKAVQSPKFEGFGLATVEEAEHVPDILEWAKSTNTGDLEELPFLVTGDLREAFAMDSEGCLGSHCPQYKSCFAEQAKARAASADIVIVNHALLLRDIALKLASDGAVGVLPPADYVVIDEAHHLEEVTTDAFGSEATLTGWHRIANQFEALTIKHDSLAAQLAAGALDEDTVAAAKLGELIKELGSGIDRFFSLIRERLLASGQTTLTMGDDARLIGPTATVLLNQARLMFDSCPHWITEDHERTQWGKLGKRMKEYGETLLAVAEPAPPGTVVRYAELNGRYKTVALHVKPIDVSEILRDALFDSTDYQAVIATSATIATADDDPFAFWRERVGMDGGRTTRTLQVDSPFDYPHNSLLYLPANGRDFDPTQSRSGESMEYLDKLAAEYERLILASDGRAFALFTSFRTLNEVYSRLSPRLSRYLVLRQGELPRPELVKQFREHGQAVLFGVKSFWEGVDVQGPALSLVIIDKLPFAPPDDPVWEARKLAVNAKYNDEWAWFNRLAIPNAIIALKQGFGRLIRTKQDRGVVAILDGRLSYKGYGARIVRALPPATPTRSLEAVRAFYAH